MTEKTQPGSNDYASLLKQALRALEQMNQRLQVSEQRAHRPIAIIGMGCRFPGDVQDGESFWKLLSEGREAVSEVPSDRWNIDDYYDPDSSKPGTIVSRFGGFLSDIDRFDAAFFGIAPREAAMMDPQQRLLLEVTWHALEDAAIAPRSLAGTRTGMYLGIAGGDYGQMQLQARDASLLDVHYASGVAHSIASGRISYLLGLKGPSLSIDTACSSSLVAVHLACQALRSGECTTAIAGGVNLILAPETTVALSQAHMLAPDGRSKAFDDRADGFARAEGCGVVILKSLDQAAADGDRILAVIRGTALNQDGASSSLTAPNGPSQEDLMRRALEDAGMTPAQIGYVEAHGTGTELGDPIELRALGSIYGAAHTVESPLLVGSLKTNFGHMEAAAGIGGLIKLVLALEHGEIPAHLQFQTPTSHVPWDRLKLTVPRTKTSWPYGVDEQDKSRIGAVSSFGFSGTNAHLIVEQAPTASPHETLNHRDDSSLHVLPLSTKDDGALRELALRYEGSLGDESFSASWLDVAATSGVGRDHFQHRIALVANSNQDAARSLRQVLSQKMPLTSTTAPRLRFLFTGQGSEQSGMGLELLERSEVFRSAIERLEAALDGVLGQTIASIWANQSGEQKRASLIQPALYAYGFALSELWRSWGVEPEMVLGHSLGEYIAATVAGVMTADEAIRLVAARGRLTEELGEPGGMVAIVTTEAEVKLLISGTGLSIAAVNGPSSVVVSGREAAITAFETQLRSSGLRHKRLGTTHGFHSSALDGMLAAFEAEAGRLSFKLPEVSWISNVTGQAIERRQPMDANYWRRQLREPVQFARALTAMESTSPCIYVELGAEPQLLALAEANGIANDRLIPSISKSGQGGEWQRLLTAAARLYTNGVDLNWKAISGSRPFRKVSLPGYPFQRQRFWFDDNRRRRLQQSSLGNTYPTSDRVPVAHPLLGSRLRSHTESAMFHGELTPSSPPHLGDHIVMGRRILPGAAYLELALAAARRATNRSAWSAVQIEFREPCVFDDARLVETTIHEPEETDGKRRFEIASTTVEVSDNHIAQPAETEWTVHATGFVGELSTVPEGALSEDIQVFKQQASVIEDHEGFYRRFQSAGLEFGLALRPVQHAWRSGQESLVEFELLSEIDDTKQYEIHPIALDACLQAAALLTNVSEPAAPALPANVEAFRLLGDPSTLRYARATIRKRQGRATTVDIRGIDADGNVLLTVDGLSLVELPLQQYRGWLHEIKWEPISLAYRDSATANAVPEYSIAIDSEAWSQEFSALAQRNQISEFDRWMRDFDRVCAAWIADSFERGGFALTPGHTFDLQELIEIVGVAPVHHRLAGRFLEVLAESGYIEKVDIDRYTALEKAPFDLARETERLADRGHPEFAWTERSAKQLLPLLRGDVNPVDVLFSEGGRKIATRLYRESAGARTLNPALVSAVIQAVNQLRKPARILEIGGGTAAATSYLVPALSGRFGEYVWTDIGAGFVSAARREFVNVDGMRFQTFDLERDPATQDLAEKRFDIIVASNVVHATADLRQALQHIHSLLRPGGLLLLAETIDKQPWIDLTVGFTDGWWRFTDHDLRPDYTLINRQSWKSLLNASGFGEVTLMPDGSAGGQEDGLLANQCLIAAIAEGGDGSSSRRPQASHVVILTANGDDGKSIPCEALADAARTSHSTVSIMPSELPSAEISKEIEEWFGHEPSRRTDSQKALDIFYLAAVETDSIDTDSPGEAALAWQNKVLSGALAWTQALLAADRLKDCRLWFISRGAFGPDVSAPGAATLAGFARSVRAEYPDTQIHCVDLPPNGDGRTAVERLWRLRQTALPLPMQLALRDNSVFAPRLVPRLLTKSDPSRDNSASTTDIGSRSLSFPGTGLLEDLKPASMLRRAPGRDEVEISVSAAPINFHEVLSALDSGSPHDYAPGGECSGVVTRLGENISGLQVGDSIVAVGPGLMADFATLSRDRVWKIPSNLSLDEAATLLIPFLTARWSLARVARVQPGEQVLIHAGAGGVGLAAIHEAHRLGAIVFATAGSESKRAYLRSLGIEGVFDSRSSAFENEVLAATGFRGVNVVLNSLAGDKVAAGLRTLAPRGRFIELGESTVLTDAEARTIRPDVTYHRVHLRSALLSGTPEVGEMIASVLDDAKSGVVRPLPCTTFPLGEAAEAFRFMASGQHTGRVLIVPQPLSVLSIKTFAGFRRDGAYVVTGGFSGLGKLVVEWLAQQGAGCILAVGRSAPDVEAEELFSRLREGGATVLAVRCDVSDSSALEAALTVIPKPYVLRGVFHSAGALDDATLPQQTPDKFQRVLAAKVAGSWNLHQLTRKSQLDCFVLFSSAAGVFGSRGQSNHAGANAYLDALAHYRREHLRLPALSINWGAWSGVGAAVRHGVVERSERAGAASIAPADGLRLLGRLLDEDCTQVLVSVIDWRKWAASRPAEAAANADLLSQVLQSQPARKQQTTAAAASQHKSITPRAARTAELSWRGQFSVSPEPQRRLMLDSRVEERIRAVLSFPARQSIDRLRPLQEYGLDSLLSIELRNALSADLESKLPATTLFDYPTLASLTDWLFHDVLKIAVKEPPTSVGKPAPEQRSLVEGVESLSDEEVEKLFQQKMTGMRQ